MGSLLRARLCWSDKFHSGVVLHRWSFCYACFTPRLAVNLSVSRSLGPLTFKTDLRLLRKLSE